MAWTEEEKRIATKRYPNEITADIARDLGRSCKQIYEFAKRAGLKKSREFYTSDACGRAGLSERGRNSRFKPDHKTWNAGIKGWDAGGRSKETQFKVGQKPHSWHPIGHERISRDGYLQRKVTDTGVTRVDFRPVHHLVWEEAGNGRVPPGHALCFKDGNRFNFAIENLEILSRGDLMKRNSVHNYGEEIFALVQLKGAINRQINKRQKNGGDQHQQQPGANA